MAEPEAHLDGGQTIRSVSRHWTSVLTGAGISDAAADVRRLVTAALGMTAAQALAAPERPLSGPELATLNGHMARRLRREPVSRILGERDFYGRTFSVTPATLDPRPDTETLVEAALEIIRQESWDRGDLRILDVGTGSGCLLISLLCELPGARGTGTDISAAALAVACANAERLGVADRAAWLTADALETVRGPFHITVSNPPYVRTGDIAQLDPEVRNFDPASALDGGADGLAFYRRLAQGIAGVAPDGWAVLEVGFDQADAVVNIMRGAGSVVASRVYRDVAGKRRCVAVKTRAKAHA